jgi:glycosyltransferase involved in cell wall biosynthesis
VAYASQHFAAPLSEAGVITVPYGDCEGLAEASVKILTDRELWLELHQRSQESYQTYFAWESIASRFVKLFDHA